MKNKYHVLMLLLVATFFGMLMTMCKVNHQKKIGYLVNNLEKDSTLNTSHFAQLLAFDTLGIDYLIDLGELVYPRQSIGFDDYNVSSMTCTYHISNKLSALHLICAIYYENYYFCSTRILYDSTIFELNGNPKSLLCIQDERIRTQAWNQMLVWRKKMKGQPINYMRRNNLPPVKTEYIWLGQKECTIDSEFKQSYFREFKSRENGLNGW